MAVAEHLRFLSEKEYRQELVGLNDSELRTRNDRLTGVTKTADLASEIGLRVIGGTVLSWTSVKLMDWRFRLGLTKEPIPTLHKVLMGVGVGLFIFGKLIRGTTEVGQILVNEEMNRRNTKG